MDPMQRKLLRMATYLRLTGGPKPDPESVRVFAGKAERLLREAAAYTPHTEA